MPETRDRDDIAAALIAHKPMGSKPHGMLVKTVVCELRFPLLMELGDERPPASFVKALRKNYPTVEQLSEISVGPGASTTPTSAHLLRAMRGGWAVTLKPSAVSIEVKAYPGYDKFRERVAEVIEGARPVIDSDFWTRVGLRYINEIPIETSSHVPMGQLINPSLAATLDANVFHGVRDYSGRILGEKDGRGFTLQHGLKREASSKGTQELAYKIDIDMWRTEVEIDASLKVLDELHEQSYALFDWTLGDVTRKNLGKSQ